MSEPYKADLLIKRGGTQSITAYIGKEGELAYNTDTKEIFYFDGITQGGIKLTRTPKTLKLSSFSGASGDIVTGDSVHVALQKAQGNFESYTTDSQKFLKNDGTTPMVNYTPQVDGDIVTKKYQDDETDLLIPKTDINITVAGLTSGKVDASVLPKEAKSQGLQVQTLTELYALPNVQPGDIILVKDQLAGNTFVAVNENPSGPTDLIKIEIQPIEVDWDGTGNTAIKNRPLVINDLTSGGNTDLLSAEMGKSLKIEIDALAGEANIQSDWTETDTNNDAFIKNKPDLTVMDAGVLPSAPPALTT